MRYAELIEQRNESWQRESITLDRALSMIQTKCQKAWAAYQQHIRAYRGVYARGEFYWGQTGFDRRPQDSSLELQKLTDQAIRQHLGPNAAVRSNSVFATGDADHAFGYGDQLYVIFPWDSAAITWSKTYDDLVLDITTQGLTFSPLSTMPSYEKFIDLLHKQNTPPLPSNPVIKTATSLTLKDPKSYTELKRLIEQLQKQPEPFQDAAVQSGFWSDLQKLGTPYSYYYVSQLIQLNLAQFDAEQFIQKFQPQTGDWKKAVQSQHEIYIKGEYVLVSTEAIDQL